MEERAVSASVRATSVTLYQWLSGIAEMDLYPHRLIRHIMLGDREKVLGSKDHLVPVSSATRAVPLSQRYRYRPYHQHGAKISTAEGKEKETIRGFLIPLHGQRKKAWPCQRV